MAIEALDHFTIVTSDLAAARRFYIDVLGLGEGDRPPFRFPGAWLYCGGAPVVHLISRDTSGGASTGAVDHLALRASDLAGTVARLREFAVDYDLRTVPGLGLRQVFVHDPDGVKIELNFAASERLPDDA
ncbi:MAG: VOC family protein [Alphaproteobacteria bacterium]